MTRTSKAIRTRLGSERGTSTMEFALLATPLFLLLAGSVELGYNAYTRGLSEGTMREASRMAATGRYTEAQIKSYVTTQVDSIYGSEANVDFRSYDSFEDVKKPEPLVSDAEPLGGTPGTDDCYLDINNNSQWDEDAVTAGTVGIGGGDDIVYLGVDVTYPALFGFVSAALGRTGGDVKIELNTIAKNEPYNGTTGSGGGSGGSDPGPDAAVTRCIS